MCLQKGGTKDLASLVRDLMQVTRSKKDYKVPSSEINEQGLQLKTQVWHPEDQSFHFCFHVRETTKAKLRRTILSRYLRLRM
jgi:hypothetical protein